MKNRTIYWINFLHQETITQARTKFLKRREENIIQETECNWQGLN